MRTSLPPEPNNSRPLPTRCGSIRPSTWRQSRELPAADLEAAARLYAEADRAMILYGLGVTEHHDGSLGVMGCANLALLTGNVGRKGTGVNPLRGQNNVQGACDMGALPNVLPGYQSVEDERVRGQVREGLGLHACPTGKGLKFTEAWHHARRKRVRAAYIVGHNPAATDPHTPTRGRVARRPWTFSSSTKSSSRKPRNSPTSSCLPPLSPRRTERSSTPTARCNACARPSNLRPTARPTWRSSASWPSGWATRCLRSAAEIMDEIAAPGRRSWPASATNASNVSRWSGPASARRISGVRRLYETTFPRGRATFQAIDASEPLEQIDADYPLILTTGRRLEHYCCGSMTRRTAGLLALAPEERLEIHPQDAASLGVEDGAAVEVASRRSTLTVRARLTERCRPGVVFLSFHFEETPTNQLLGNYLDALACTPDYKVTAVRVTPKA